MRAIVLGVNGMTGRAIAAALADAGWEVVGSGRDARRFPPELRDRGVRVVVSDRHEPAQLRQLLSDGADVVVDCVCYTAEHARRLIECRDCYGSAVVLSSKAVYVDDEGRHSNSDAPPCFAGPVSERQPVLEPDFSGAYASREGYGANKVAAERTLLGSGAAVSVLRPSRVHGPGAAHARELFVVGRLLDGRRRIPVAHRGRCANHPTAAVNLARLVLACAQRPGERILNVADAGAPTAGEIVGAIAAAAGRDVEVVGLDDDAAVELGWTPWSSWPPFLLDTAAATELCGGPAGSYAETVVPTVDWLLGLSEVDRGALRCHPALRERFDYALDDAALAV